LDTIVENACESPQDDGGQMQTWVKSLYQDVIEKTSKEIGQSFASESASTHIGDIRSANGSDNDNSSDAQTVESPPSVDIAG